MANVRDICPICGGRLTLVHLECVQCHTKLEGDIAILGMPSPESGTRDADAGRFGALARLSREQLTFIETFIRARGIIKTVEGMLGISYPTVRSKLDDVITTMGHSPTDEHASGDARKEQREILIDLAEGRLTTQGAHDLLRRLARSTGSMTDAVPEEEQ